MPERTHVAQFARYEDALAAAVADTYLHGGFVYLWELDGRYDYTYSGPPNHKVRCIVTIRDGHTIHSCPGQHPERF